ncbi:MAG TPA: hypothetical protein VNL91_04880, partial [Thermoanaerobaculia bacterium]|nr:hypothetical protein [Thermoanaerobaculia bacterium]
VIAAAVSMYERAGEGMPARPPKTRPAPIAWTPALPDLDPPEPSSAVPTLVRAGEQEIEERVRAYAGELAKMWTRHPEELVDVVAHAATKAGGSQPVSLLLAIAHAETNGNILTVSEAGAVGLAQATPVAIQQEAVPGKLFVTNDYLVGARAYITKKPLGDADTIASIVLLHDTPKTRARAKRLLKSAMALRREGLDELDLLAPFAPDVFFTRIEAADRHNRAILGRLERLLAKGSRAEIRGFRNEVRREYRALKAMQVASWKQYQRDLAARRDAMLERQFGRDADFVRREMTYEAAEYLGEHLDVRFSAKRMAEFLVSHLERKVTEARKLASSEREIESMTAALYNGGSHNVKRMLAGLIGSLPETQKYMKKVPATRRRLDAVAGSAFGGR